MISQIEALTKSLASKPTWSAKDLVPKLQSVSTLIENELNENGKILNVSSSKRTKVQVIKKCDILYLPLVGIPHYFLVHKIIGDLVYGTIFTTTYKPEFCIHEVKQDRILEGSFACNTYFCVDLNQAKESFIRAYESKTEASIIISKTTSHYKRLFK